MDIETLIFRACVGQPVEDVRDFRSAKANNGNFLSKVRMTCDVAKTSIPALVTESSIKSAPARVPKVCQ
jgi:hypothetical protein